MNRSTGNWIGMPVIIGRITGPAAYGADSIIYQDCFYMKTKLLNLYLTAQIAVVFAMGVHIASNHRPVPVELELTATLNCVNSDCVDTQAGLTERLPHLTDGRWYQYAITRYP